MIWLPSSPQICEALIWWHVTSLPLLTSCVALGKLPDLSESPFHLGRMLMRYRRGLSRCLNHGDGLRHALFPRGWQEGVDLAWDQRAGLCTLTRPCHSSPPLLGEGGWLSVVATPRSCAPSDGKKNTRPRSQLCQESP